MKRRRMLAIACAALALTFACASPLTSVPAQAAAPNKSTASTYVILADGQILRDSTGQIATYGSMQAAEANARSYRRDNPNSDVHALTLQEALLRQTAGGGAPQPEPDNNDPGTPEPDTTEPDAPEPDTTEPDAPEPDTTDPGTPEPDTTDPGTPEPDTTEPDTTEPDATEPDADQEPTTEPPLPPVTDAVLGILPPPPPTVNLAALTESAPLTLWVHPAGTGDGLSQNSPTTLGRAVQHLADAGTSHAVVRLANGVRHTMPATWPKAASGKALSRPVVVQPWETAGVMPVVSSESGGVGIRLMGSRYIVFYGVHFAGPGEAAVSIVPDASNTLGAANVIFDGCTFKGWSIGMTMVAEEGAYATSSCLIDNCTFLDNDLGGVRMLRANGVTIRNSVLDRNGTMSATASGIGADTCIVLNVSSNLVSRVNGSGLDLRGVRDAVVSGNVFVGNTTAMRIGAPDRGVLRGTITRNVVVNHGGASVGAAVILAENDTVTLDGNIVVNSPNGSAPVFDLRQGVDPLLPTGLLANVKIQNSIVYRSLGSAFRLDAGIKSGLIVGDSIVQTPDGLSAATIVAGMEGKPADAVRGTVFTGNRYHLGHLPSDGSGWFTDGATLRSVGWWSTLSGEAPAIGAATFFDPARDAALFSEEVLRGEKSLDALYAAARGGSVEPAALADWVRDGFAVVATNDGGGDPVVEDEPQQPPVDDTLPPMPADGKIWYVATEGSDTNDGLTQQTPLKTLPEAVKRAVSGRGDRILLKRGGAFLADSLGMTISGASETAPFVLGAYGSGARPIVKVANNGLMILGPGGEYSKHVWLADLDIYRESADPNSPNFTEFKSRGVRASRVAADFRVLRCRFRHCSLTAVNVDSAARINGLRIIDTSFAYSNDGLSHSEGVYFGRVDNWHIENVLVLRNGYDYRTGEGRTKFDQGIYVHAENGHGTCKGLISIDNAASGVQFRSDATVDGVIAIGNFFGVNLGRGGSKFREGGVKINARNIWVSDGLSMDGSNPRAIDAANLLPGSTIENAICDRGGGIELSGNNTDGMVGCHVAVKNVYGYWGIRLSGTLSGLSGTSITDARLGELSDRDKVISAVKLTNVAAAAPNRDTSLPLGLQQWLTAAEKQWGQGSYRFDALWSTLTERQQLAGVTP